MRKIDAEDHAEGETASAGRNDHSAEAGGAVAFKHMLSEWIRRRLNARRHENVKLLWELLKRSAVPP